MQYQVPYPSSVPHITLVPYSFALDPLFFYCSLAIQILFVLLCTACLAFSLYFCMGNHKLLRDLADSKKDQRQQENIINEVVVKTNYLQKQSSQEDNSQTEQQEEQQLESMEMGVKMRVFQRRALYCMSFSISWLLCVNLFRAGVELVVLAALMVAVMVVCNVKTILKKWKVARLVYILPVIACFVPYLTSSGSLYSWTKVLEPIKLGR